jgi:hypothetical protein
VVSGWYVGRNVGLNKRIPSHVWFHLAGPTADTGLMSESLSESDENKILSYEDRLIDESGLFPLRRTLECTGPG